MDLNNDDSYDIHYPQLQKLVLESSALWIPRNTPMLGELSSSSEAVCAHPTILDTIPPKLKKLELLLARGLFLVDEASVKMCLHRLVQHNQLKDLIIHFDSSDSNGTVFDAVCHLGQLHTLIIYVWKNSLTSWSLDVLNYTYFGSIVIMRHLPEQSVP